MSDKPGPRMNKWVLLAILFAVALTLYASIFYKVANYGA